MNATLQPEAETPSPRELLGTFSASGSEEAFTGLVRCYAGMVVGTAARVTGRPDLAEDIAQEVFALLARRARSVSAATLGGWLHRVTVRRAVAAAKSETSRNRRHLQAAMNDTSLTTPAVEFGADVLPALDRALDSLPAADREVVVLRFYERLSFNEIAARLPLSAEAARKRTARALERLARALKSRGVTVGVAALGAGLAAGVRHGAAAPNASTLARQALAAAPALSAWTVLQTVTATVGTAKAALIAAAVLTVAVGAPLAWSLLDGSERSVPTSGSPPAGRTLPSQSAAAVPRSVARPAPVPGTAADVLSALKISTEGLPVVGDADSPLREKPRPLSLRVANLDSESPAVRVTIYWQPDAGTYWIEHNVGGPAACYGPVRGDPVLRHQLVPWTIARLSFASPLYLGTTESHDIMQDLARSGSRLARKYGWQIAAGLENPSVTACYSLATYFPGNTRETMESDALDPELGPLVTAAKAAITRARSSLESAKQLRPDSDYLPAEPMSAADAAAFAWGEPVNGLSAALVVPGQIAPGEKFPIEWIIRNVSGSDIRLLHHGDGGPTLEITSADGDRRTKVLDHRMEVSFQIERPEHRRLLRAGDAVRVKVTYPVEFTFAPPVPAALNRSVLVSPGPAFLQLTLYVPGTFSGDDLTGKVITPCAGEWEGILKTAPAAIQVR